MIPHEVLRRELIKAADLTHLNLAISLTEHCNFRCTYCYESFELGSMSNEYYEALRLFARREIPKLKGTLINLLRDSMALLRRAHSRGHLHDVSWSLRAVRPALRPLATIIQRVPKCVSASLRSNNGLLFMARLFLAVCLCMPASPGIATELAFLWQTAPTAERLEQAAARLQVSIRDAHLHVEFTAGNPSAKALRAVRRAPDSFLERDTRLLLYVDGSGSGKFARVFGINAAGGLFDGTYQEGGEVDSGADFLWQGTAVTGENSWRAEMLIPLHQLGIATGAVPRLYAEYYQVGETFQRFATADARSAGGCTLCVAQSVPELSVVAIEPKRLQIRPGVYTLAGQLADELGRIKVSEHKVTLDAQWTPTNSLNLRGTWNPNFSDREPDFPMLRYGTPFTPELSETRQFFARSSDVFQVAGLPVVNTRSLSAPEFAVIVDHTTPLTRSAALLASDAGGGLVLLPRAYSNDFAHAPSSTAWLARSVVTLEAADAGFMLAERRYANAVGSNRVGALDGAWRFGGDYKLAALASVSETTACGSSGKLTRCDPARGSALRASLSRTAALDGFSITYRQISPNYRSDLGWLPQSGVRSWQAYAYLSRENLFAWLRKATFSSEIIMTEDAQGQSIERAVKLPLQLETELVSMELALTPMAKQRLQPLMPMIGTRRVQLLAIGSPSETFSKLAVQASYGELPDYANAVGGRGLELGAEATFNLNRDVGLQVVTQYYRTRGDLSLPYSGPSYEEGLVFMNAAWQFAAFSRVRYLLTLGQRKVMSSLTLNTSKLRTNAHSLLLENAPRSGLGWAIQAATTQRSGAVARSWEVLAKISYGY